VADQGSKLITSCFDLPEFCLPGLITEPAEQQIHDLPRRAIEDCDLALGTDGPRSVFFADLGHLLVVPREELGECRRREEPLRHPVQHTLVHLRPPDAAAIRAGTAVQCNEAGEQAVR
jgi:hypothetical protein